MKRFVSYLYSVYNNQKIHNAGFARIELRTGRNRIDIHLQENGYAGKNGTVYLFVRNQENIQGIPIGTIIFRNNQADFRYEQPEENIGQTSWQIMQMSGIVVQIEDRIAFLSQWDEKPVDTDRFEVWSSGQTDAVSSEETISQKEESTVPRSVMDSEETEQDHVLQPGRASSGTSAVPQSGQVSSGTADVSQSSQARSEAANEIQAGEIKEDVSNNIEANQKQEDIDFSASPDTPTQTSTIHTAEIQPQLQLNRSNWEQTWRYMLRMYPVLNQFAEEDNVLCVRIEIKDVRLLPEKYWSMVNNSFLLHGFFNYRYLVFGRIGQNWFIGIPGIYQNQEHVMASIFGFPDFLSQAQKNERGEQPGYWYRVLKI